MSNFKYGKLFQLVKDLTEYKKLNCEPIVVTYINGKKIINVTKTLLENIAKEAFYEISHFLRQDHILRL